MSHARQPFSRSGIVSGVKVKKSTVKYPPELNRRVNLGNVKWEVMKPWIARRVTELLTVEDDVLISMIYNLLEQEQVHKNGGEIYAQLQTFLEQHTATFMKVCDRASARPNPRVCSRFSRSRPSRPTRRWPTQHTAPR